MNFPKDFLWGAATSSYQIEGAVREGGRGATIWDTFCATVGKVANGDTGDVACDHYHRYRDDVKLMQALGLQTYRFSIAWSRILPEGVGKVNTQGLDFYSALVDTLLEANIVPMVTLYHWDLPQALQDKGGWAQRDTMQAFADYAHVVTQKLGDRVTRWATHNEPWVIAVLGNMTGEHAPGLQDPRIALQVAHHLLVSHGMALDAIRANVRGAEAGIVLNLSHIDPASDALGDREAAQLWDGHLNRWFLDPLFKGTYPDDLWAFYGVLAPEVGANDMAYIARPIDFLGVNYYTRHVIGAGRETPFNLRFVRTSNPYTAMDWEVYPDGLEQLLLRLHQDYRAPALYITENGCAYDDVLADGAVQDSARRDYLEAHFAAASRAIAAGVPLKGYYVWSLLDNFEWAWGYSKRFGIVYVDYKTQARTPKASALWYRDFIQAQQ